MMNSVWFVLAAVWIKGGQPPRVEDEQDADLAPPAGTGPELLQFAIFEVVMVSTSGRPSAGPDRLSV
jgi:hypothetical protein